MGGSIYRLIPKGPGRGRLASPPNRARLATCPVGSSAAFPRTRRPAATGDRHARRVPIRQGADHRRQSTATANASQTSSMRSSLSLDDRAAGPDWRSTRSRPSRGSPRTGVARGPLPAGGRPRSLDLESSSCTGPRGRVAGAGSQHHVTARRWPDARSRAARDHQTSPRSGTSLMKLQRRRGTTPGLPIRRVRRLGGRRRRRRQRRSPLPDCC